MSFGCLGCETLALAGAKLPKKIFRNEQLQRCHDVMAPARVRLSARDSPFEEDCEGETTETIGLFGC